MIFLLLNPAVLCLLVWMVSRGQAEYDYPRMFFIALGASLFGIAITTILSPILGFISLILILIFMGYLLMRYCFLTLPQTGIVVGLYLAYQLVIHAILG